MGITKITRIDQNILHDESSSWTQRSEAEGSPTFINLEVEILTGRTHQIRYHLSQHGLPIRGDYLYMDKKDLNPDDIMHLQAYRLQFLDIDWVMIDVECEKSW